MIQFRGKEGEVVYLGYSPEIPQGKSEITVWMEVEMKHNYGLVKLLFIIVSNFFYDIQSAQAMDVDIKITGSVFIPPCKINDTDIQFSFGRLSLYEIDGHQNAVTKTISVSCEYYQGTPYLHFDGERVFDSVGNILKTTGVNASTLGIALYQGHDVNSSYPLIIGAGKQGKNGYKITRGLTGKNSARGQFTFTAVPYKYGRDILEAGDFSATAVMSISYQ